MLYSRYSNPLEFMRLYIDQGRFGEFVSDILNAENRRKQEQEDKESEERLWAAYIHSYSDKSFVEWKAEILQPVKQQNSTGKRYTAAKRDEDMTKADIDRLLARLFPEKPDGHSATK